MRQGTQREFLPLAPSASRLSTPPVLMSLRTPYTLSFPFGPAPTLHCPFDNPSLHHVGCNAIASVYRVLPPPRVSHVQRERCCRLGTETEDISALSDAIDLPPFAAPIALLPQSGPSSTLSSGTPQPPGHPLRTDTNMLFRNTAKLVVFVVGALAVPGSKAVPLIVAGTGANILRRDDVTQLSASTREGVRGTASVQ